MFSTAAIKYNFNYNSTTVNVSYDLADSNWDGGFLDGGVLSYVFSDTTKAALSNTSAFQNAVSSWGANSVINFTSNGTAAVDLVIFEADTDENLPANNDGTAAGRTYWFDFTGTEHSRAEIAIDDDVDQTSSFALYAALHEIGHALGLKGDAAISDTYTTDMTVMSYNVPSGSRFAVTPMAYDIAAIEEIYGANSLNAASNTYGHAYFSGTNRSLTVQDTGGIDTFDLSGEAGTHRIDLRQAIKEDGDWADAGSIINGQEYVYLARGTVIEKAIGGTGNDTLIGSSAVNAVNNVGEAEADYAASAGANTLEGGGGDDDIYGLGGNDLLLGDEGYDQYYFSASGDGQDTINDGDGVGSIIIDGNTIGQATETATPYEYEFTAGGTTYTLTLTGVNETTDRIGDLTISYGTGDSIKIENFHADGGDLGITLGEPNTNTADPTPSQTLVYTHLNDYWLLVTETATGAQQNVYQSDFNQWSNKDDYTASIVTAPTNYTPLDVIRPEAGDILGTAGVEDWDFRYQVVANGGYTADALGGDDIIHSHSTTTISQTVRGGDGNDSITTHAGLGAAYGDAGNDVLENKNVSGVWGDVELYGGDGNDAFHGIANTIDGGSGIDIWHFADTSHANINLQTNTAVLDGKTIHINSIEAVKANIYGSTGSSITAGNYGDYIHTEDGDDTIYGMGGNDTIYAGSGANQIDAGAGNDSIFLEGTGGFVNGGYGNDIIIAGQGLNNTLHGGHGDDDISGSNNLASIDYLYGGDGNDSIYAGQGHNIIDGGSGDDSINGATNGDDSLMGGDGNDIIIAGGGSDTIKGGAGNDILYADNGPFSGGIDFIEDTLGNNTIHGYGADDTITAGDTVITGDGNDHIIYGSRQNSISSGGGNDIIESDYAFHNNTVHAGAGDDLVTINGFDNIIYLDAGNDTLNASGGGGVYYGGAGNDSLTAAASSSYLYGDDGDDILSGGHGSVLTGGAGADIFLLGINNSAFTIADFEWDNPNEKIDLTGKNTSASDLIVNDLGTQISLGGFGNSISLVGVTIGNLSADSFIGLLPALDPFSGTPFDDTIYGDANANSITGYFGDDEINGDAGNDSLYGEGGNDTIDGGDGNDEISGGAGNDSLDGGLGDDTVYGGTGNDTIDGGAGNDTIGGGDGNDSIVGGAGNDTLSGSAGNDTLIGGAGDDMYIIGGGEKYIDLGDGNDSISGSYGNNNSVSQNSTILGGAGEDHLVGYIGDDSINGGADDDSINGGAGNDTLDGGQGNDELYGGSGNDYYVVDAAGDVVTEQFVEGNDTVESSVGYILGSHLENLVLTGYANIDATGNELDNEIIGNSGDNVIYANSGGNDTVNGGLGNDVIYGDGSTDLFDGGNGEFDGGAGNDTIWSGWGDDTVDGGAGVDWFYSTGYTGNVINLATGVATGVDNGNDTLLNIENVIGASGDDSITGDSAANYLRGWYANDTIIGNGGSDTLQGDFGADLLIGGTDNEILYGGDGSDTHQGGAGDDGYYWFTSLDDGDGITENDVIEDSAGAADFLDLFDDINSLSFIRTGDDLVISHNTNGFDTITIKDQYTTGAIETFTLNNVSYSATHVQNLGLPVNIDGTAGDDAALSGNAVSNVINGFAGNDTITTGEGNDTVNGGAGTDQFIIEQHAGSTTTITDFDWNNARERIDLSAFSSFFVNGLSDVRSATTIVDGNAQIDLGGIQTLVIENVPAVEMLTHFAFTGLTDSVTPYGESDHIILGNDGGDDVIEGDGSSSNLNDIIASQAGYDVVSGGAGNDALTGGTGNDTLFGGDGDDTINGSAGNDLLIGGAGNDTIDDGLGFDTIYAGAGDDLIDTTTEDSSDLIYGEDGNDTILSGNGNDTVYGGAGNDLVSATYGNNTIDGGDGNDTIYADLVAADSVGGGGTDYVEGGLGQDKIYGYGSNDTLYGGINDVNDTLDLRDSIYGGYGDDEIYGEAGDDWLQADAGNDTISGGAGADTFYFYTLMDGGNPIDMGDKFITDFEGAGVAGGDVIRIAANTGFTMFSELSIDYTIAGRAEIDLGNGSTVTLTDFNDTLVAGDFYFG